MGKGEKGAQKYFFISFIFYNLIIKNFWGFCKQKMQYKTAPRLGREPR